MSTNTAALTPQQILAAARLLVFQRAPYFRAGVLNLVPRESPGLGTFASTKNWILMWDPEKAETWGVEGVAAVLVHELSHLVRDHFGRFSAPLINRDLANIAGDLSINPGVVEMGFHLPEGGLFPGALKLPDGLTAEQYYAHLLKMDVEYVYYDSMTGEVIDAPHGKIGVHGCGSCSGRERRDEPSDAEGQAEGRSEAEIRRAKITIAKAIQRGRGYIPGDLKRWADDALKPPKVPWREKLSRACRAAVAFRPGAGHSTYSRISRRQGGLGFGPGCPVLPSYRATIPRVTFLVDTSGSMAEESLHKAMSEAQGIFDACGAHLTVAVCDAALHGMKQVKSIKEACKMLSGGGGSDFNPAFEEIARRKPKTDIVIAATDGDITVPAKAPAGIHVIWLLVQKSYGGTFRRPCSWGTAIEVE